MVSYFYCCHRWIVIELFLYVMAWYYWWHDTIYSKIMINDSVDRLMTLLITGLCYEKSHAMNHWCIVMNIIILFCIYRSAYLLYDYWYLLILNSAIIIKQYHTRVVNKLLIYHQLLFNSYCFWNEYRFMQINNLK